MKKQISEKNVARFFKICKYTFLILEKGDKWKNVSVFVNTPFFIFEKGYQRKNCARIFKIYKYSFLKLGTGDKWQNCVRFFKIDKYTCFNIWKRQSVKKMCQDL